jgi:hypothetical protein
MPARARVLSNFDEECVDPLYGSKLKEKEEEEKKMKRKKIGKRT